MPACNLWINVSRQSKLINKPILEKTTPFHYLNAGSVKLETGKSGLNVTQCQTFFLRFDKLGGQFLFSFGGFCFLLQCRDYYYILFTSDLFICFPFLLSIYVLLPVFLFYYLVTFYYLFSFSIICFHFSI